MIHMLILFRMMTLLMIPCLEGIIKCCAFSQERSCSQIMHCRTHNNEYMFIHEMHAVGDFVLLVNFAWMSGMAPIGVVSMAGLSSL